MNISLLQRTMAGIGSILGVVRKSLRGEPSVSGNSRQPAIGRRVAKSKKSEPQKAARSSTLAASHAWLVPISSVNGIAHYMPTTTEGRLVVPLCKQGRFNPRIAEVIPHARPCENCRQMLEARGKE